MRKKIYQGWLVNAIESEKWTYEYISLAGLEPMTSLGLHLAFAKWGALCILYVDSKLRDIS